MEVAPLPAITPKESEKESFTIKQNSKIYKLNIEIQNQNIILNISEEKALYEEYEMYLTFEKLKQIHKVFSMITSFQEFIEYMKALIDNNKIIIHKDIENQISIKMIVEYLLKQNTIQIDLKLKKMNLDIIVKDMLKQITNINNKLQKIENNYIELKEENKNIKIENNNFKEENKILNEQINLIKKDNNVMTKLIDSIKKEVNELKNDNKILKEKINNANKGKLLLNKTNININSSIMKKGEFEIIKETIEKKMNSEIKEVKKIFQATIDGGDPVNFYK